MGIRKSQTLKHWKRVQKPNSDQADGRFLSLAQHPLIVPASSVLA
jgi:hypothetical protein